MYLHLGSRIWFSKGRRLGRRPDDAHIIGNGSPIQRTRRARGATMALIERVTDYSVAQLKNDVVDYQQVVNLTTESGIKVFIAFPDNPPAEWITSDGTTTTVYLQRGQFDRVHRLLQSEAPVFFTAFSLFHRNFVLTTGTELPGEGPADPDALAQLMAGIRQHAADSESRD